MYIVTINIHFHVSIIGIVNAYTSKIPRMTIPWTLLAAILGSKHHSDHSGVADMKPWLDLMDE